MPVTQKAIAERLGVSRQLVTFALNGGGSVSETRRHEIREAAREMGYQRNELARAMVTGRSRTIGVLTYAGTTEHISTIIAGALAEAVKEGYAVKVLHLPNSGLRQAVGEAVSEIVQRCTSWQLDGAVAISLNPDVLQLLSVELQKGQCPLAYVENVAVGSGEILVRTDDRSAFRAAIGHLAGLGHRRIVHLSGPSDHPLTISRNAIFLEILREFDLPVSPDSLAATHPTRWMHRARVEAAVEALLERPERPTAIICFGDASAMIAMRVARRCQVPVPEALSVVGFGNFTLSEHADPPLTSITQPFHNMGRLAVQRLIEHITSDGSAVRNGLASNGFDELPAHLVVRESTAPPAT